jgi:cytoskeleton protein RodZ
MTADGSQVNKKNSPGAILLQARLEAGLTYEDVATELYMTVTKIKALETDDYSNLNSDTFVRGYLRAYANLLKLDASTIITTYEQKMLKDQVLLGPLQAPPIPVSPNRNAWKFLVIIGGVLLLLWLISVWFFNNHATKEFSVVAQDAQLLASKTGLSGIQPSVSSSSLSVANLSVPNLSGPSLGATQNPSVALNLNVAQSLSTSEFTRALSAEGSTIRAKEMHRSALDEIKFNFRDESWLEVSDSRGDVLATELQAAGSKLDLVGRAPFDVKLGNSDAVDIYLNGKKVAVVPQPGTNVLTLKVSN